MLRSWSAIGDADYQSVEAGTGRRRTPVIFVGSAGVRVLDNEDIIGDGPTVAKGSQRIAVRIKQGNIKIAGTDSVDALLGEKPGFDLHQHAGFLFHGVFPVE